MRNEIERHEVDRFIANQEAILRDLADLRDQMRDVLMELGGVPDSEFRDPERPPIRKRLHKLEQNLHAAQAAGAALGMLFGRTSKFVLVGAALVAAVASTLRLFGVGG